MRYLILLIWFSAMAFFGYRVAYKPQTKSITNTVIAKTVRVVGDTSVRHEGSLDYYSLQQNKDIFLNDLVRTGNNSRIRIKLDNNEILEIFENTTIKFTQNLNKKGFINIFINQGKFRLKPTQNPPSNERLIIRTSAGEVPFATEDTSVAVSIKDEEGRVLVAKKDAKGSVKRADIKLPKAKPIVFNLSALKKPEPEKVAEPIPPPPLKTKVSLEYRPATDVLWTFESFQSALKQKLPIIATTSPTLDDAKIEGYLHWQGKKKKVSSNNLSLSSVIDDIKSIDEAKQTIPIKVSHQLAAKVDDYRLSNAKPKSYTLKSLRKQDRFRLKYEAHGIVKTRPTWFVSANRSLPKGLEVYSTAFPVEELKDIGRGTTSVEIFGRDEGMKRGIFLVKNNEIMAGIFGKIEREQAVKYLAKFQGDFMFAGSKASLITTNNKDEIIAALKKNKTIYLIKDTDVISLDRSLLTKIDNTQSFLDKFSNFYFTEKVEMISNRTSR